MPKILDGKKKNPLLVSIGILVGAIAAFLVASFDGDPNTKPDAGAVIDAGVGVYDAATSDDPTVEPAGD